MAKVKQGLQALSRQEARIREKMTRRVGQIVLNFSSIENALGLAYAMTHEGGPALGGKDFYTENRFKDKIKKVDALAEKKLSGEPLKKWRRLKTRLHQVAQKRHHMAHLVLVNHVQNRVLTPKLMQPWFKPGRAGVPTYALRDIEQVAAEIEAVRSDLWDLVQGMRGF